MALPMDELELISKKVTFAPDYTRFRSICKAWRSAAPKHPQIPWLFATDDVKHNFLNLYQFSFEANKFIHFPELSKSSFLSSFLDNSNVIIRSSRGWLLLRNRLTSFVSLFNPLTNSIINLPNLPNLSDHDRDLDISGHRVGFILTSDPGDSLSDCSALIYYSEKLMYCKVGCSGWIEMQHPELDTFGSIQICCYRKQCFISSGGELLVCDFSQNPSVCKLVSFSLNDIIGTCELKFKDSYLVESDGDLLLVLVDYKYWRPFKLFKLEFERQMVKLVELKSLGDKTLFLSLDTSFSLVASKYPGCKENSIYFPAFLRKHRELCAIQLLAIHDVEKQNTMFIQDEHDGDYRLRCAWFTPSLLM